MQMKKVFKEEKASMAIYVAIVLVSFLLVLGTVFLTSVSVRKQQLATALKIKEAYESSFKYSDTIYDTQFSKSGEVLVTSLNGIQTRTVKALDGNGKRITIPAGFRVVTSEGISVDDGIVIEDEDGNQFVWVPCTVSGEAGLTPYAKDTKYNDGTVNNKQYEYTGYIDWKDEANLRENWESVAENGGFYVARYEAGIPEDADFFANKAGDVYYGEEKRNVTSYIPVSKKGYPAWTYISQVNMIAVSKKMYKENQAVRSNLIDSTAWDTIVNWMAASGVNVTDSEHYGVYNLSGVTSNGLYAENDYTDSNNPIRATTYSKGTVTANNTNLRREIATGTSEDTKVKNIYDMAGNLWECTTEVRVDAATDNKYCVERGGMFSNNKNNLPISHRNGSPMVNVPSYSFSFRVVLYINDNLETELATGPHGKPLVTGLTTIQDENVDAEDSNGARITIPAGFKVVTSEATTVNNGIVIEDEEGNQFVWVPCTTTSEAGLVSYAQDTRYNDGTLATKEGGGYSEYNDWAETANVSWNQKSVKEYGGFYVARFEAGVPENANFYADEAGDTYYKNSTTPSKNVNTYNPVSKKNNQSWNFINQTNAKTVSSNMYKNSTSVTSNLMDSYAWDTIVNWMENASSGIAINSASIGNYYSSNININGLVAYHCYRALKSSSSYGNYACAATYQTANNISTKRITNVSSSTLQNDYSFTDTEGNTISTFDTSTYQFAIYKEAATGSMEAAKIKNIYDMAGNVWEWTTEIGRSESYSLIRGGGFTAGGSGYPVSCRWSSPKANSYINVGFRVVLYIK